MCTSEITREEIARSDEFKERLYDALTRINRNIATNRDWKRITCSNDACTLRERMRVVRNARNLQVTAVSSDESDKDAVPSRRPVTNQSE